jgi:hypothetical protein
MFEKLNAGFKNYTIWDIGLTKWTVFFFTIVLVKLFPVLLTIRFRYLIVLVVLCAAKPLYKFLVNK